MLLCENIEKEKGWMRMSIIPKITCRNCKKQYSGLMNTCPHCGVKRARAPGRAPTTTDGVVSGTAANAQAAENVKWQFIFGAIILAAVILAVIVLITVSLGDAPATPTPTPTVSITPTPPPTLPPTPSPSPTPTVTSVTVTFLGTPTIEFSFRTGETIQLGYVIFPTGVEAAVVWSSSNEAVCTVSETGLVTAIGSGSATVYASCGAATTECRVLVW